MIFFPKIEDRDQIIEGVGVRVRVRVRVWVSEGKGKGDYIFVTFAPESSVSFIVMDLGSRLMIVTLKLDRNNPCH